MEGQMAKSHCSGFGHKGATHRAKRLNDFQLIGDVLHQTIPHPCPGALLVNFLPDSPTRIFTIGKSMNWATASHSGLTSEDLQVLILARGLHGSM